VGGAVSVSYFVRYEGTAQNLQAFLSHYRERHVSLLAALPGVRRIVLHTPVEWRDPFPVTPDRFMLIAQIIFDSRDDLRRALQSQQRALAREDMANFPAFDGSVYHQPALSEEVYSR